MAYTVTIHVALPGTPLLDPPGATSQAGHVWYKITDTTTNTSKSYGFQSINGKASGPGKVVITDTDNYQNPYYSRTLEISKEQYDLLEQYGENGRQEHWNHFHNQYGGFRNSCVDFTWGALNHAGLHANGYKSFLGIKVSETKELLDFEGKIKPRENIDFIKSIKPPFPKSTLNQEDTNPIPKQSWLQQRITKNTHQPSLELTSPTSLAAGAAYFHDLDLIALSEKIASACPRADTEQVARMTAQGAWQCAREKMAVRDVANVEHMHIHGKDLLVMYNADHMVTADIRKALDTPVEQSLQAMQQEQRQQQTEHFSQAHAAPVIRL